MSKGDTTRQKIIERAAGLFNSKGFAGTSMSELMAETGLKKGGIYNHFRNKEEILVEGFNFAVGTMELKLIGAIEGEKTGIGKLKKIVEFFRDYPLNPVIKGGCPLLNSIVYADNTHPEFVKQVNQVVERLIVVLEAFIKEAIEQGDIRADVNPREEAVAIISILEGGVAITRNSNKSRYMDIVVDHLLSHIDKNLAR